jgi:curved DNA-binding protein CbpA
MRFLILIFISCFTYIHLESENPYRVLKVAPYYSMADIKKAYKELIKKSHPDKIKGDKQEARKNFERIQKAYEKIKKEKKNNDGGGLWGAAKECFENTLSFLTVINIGYYLLKILPRILERIFQLADYGYYLLRGTGLIFAIIYSFFPHYFDDDFVKLTASFIITFVISLLFRDMFYGRKKKSEKKKKRVKGKELKKEENLEEDSSEGSEYDESEEGEDKKEEKKEKTQKIEEKKEVSQKNEEIKEVTEKNEGIKEESQ